MDFDEYDYLEKMVEEPLKGKETTNGGDGTNKHGEKEQSRGSKHDIDENDKDLERHSKRSKSGDESRERDRHRERGSRTRDGERSQVDRRSGRDHRERDRDKDKDREEKNGREKDRDREKEREKDRVTERRERDRESERERERDRGRENDRVVERSRRSRSHSERHRSERDERAKEKSQERENREKEREKEREEREKEREREREIRERDRESRRHKEKKEEAEPEADPERDQRTVFAYQISLKADERDVYEFFSRAGKVRDVRLIMDRNSRRSKGVGYIEFYDVMSVPMAIALSGQPLLGQPVMVKPSEAEKNLVQPTATAAGGAGGLTSPYSGGARKLYVGNLHFNITEDLLRQVFEPFGTVELVQLPLDETGHCKGFGFIQFARLEDARAAQSLNGQLEIAGRMIKVSAVTDQAGMQDVGANTADFDDDEGGGLSLNARSRAILMQKLDRTGTASNIAGSLTMSAVNTPGLPLPPPPIFGAAPGIPSLVQPSVPALAGLAGAGVQVPGAIPTAEAIGVPSECLLLKNMFDPNLETEPDFELDIKEDVEEECSKYGKVNHIYVEKNSAGFVYLRFENTQSAINAQRALHGRWFAGKMITATYMVPQTYEAKFPNSG